MVSAPTYPFCLGLSSTNILSNTLEKPVSAFPYNTVKTNGQEREKERERETERERDRDEPCRIKPRKEIGLAWDRTTGDP